MKPSAGVASTNQHELPHRRHRRRRGHQDHTLDARIPVMLVLGLALTVLALLGTIDRAPTMAEMQARDRQSAAADSPFAVPVVPARRIVRQP
jgi:hypothetical protein